MRIYILSFLVSGLSFLSSQASAAILFDFNSGPLLGGTPFTQQAGGITAQFSASPSYNGYSIQQLPVMGSISPVGFSGYCISPDSVNQSDLLISFSRPLTDISIMYSPHELATDSSCTMRITAYMGSTYINTSTYTIDPPGTWPTGSLALSSPQAFDNVVIHYDKAPPTGGDYGTIFLADNLSITPVPEPAATGLATVLVLGILGLAARRGRWQPI
jgi:hypothetical protein